MCNPNKRFKNCLENRKPINHQKTFTQFVDGFCRYQERNGSTTCGKCGGMSTCEATRITDDRVIGSFTCRTCKQSHEMSVMFTGLRLDYDKVMSEVRT